jgi:Xaa-Pro aminopeptidase
MAQQRETSVKQQRLAQFLERHDLDGVLLQHRPHFAWITNGRDNHVPADTREGVAAILATAGRRLCITSEIESARMEQEELAGTGIEVVAVPWHDRKAQAVKMIELIPGRKIAADHDALNLGLRPLPPDFAELRWSLTDEEIARYRDGARRLSLATEATCRAMDFGASEHEIAGLLNYHVRKAGLTPTVTLIAADERVGRYRHPIPTRKTVEHYAMLVTCAAYKGLISCMTRFVCFRPMTELEDRMQSLAHIDAAANLSTKPGRTLGEILFILQRAYDDQGCGDEWKRHHQGGATGYMNREVIAYPGSDVKVRPNQAFAWNPSIPGAKMEDTILATADGIEILTACSEDWPTLVGRFNGRELARPGILVK